VSKQDKKIKKSKSYQGELTESKSFITPKSLDVKRGVNFAIAKIYDAFYGQVDLIVRCRTFQPTLPL
jgi:hypothetical protein